MKFTKLITAALFTLILGHSKAQTKNEWKQASAAGYTYKYVSGDPTNSRFYTLKNGLTVILSVNKKEPRIAAQIAVRAGSNTDPKDHTGLAHYLEHMLFKGTDKFGTLNWAKEKPLLDKIDALYEQYNSTKEEAKRKEIYAEIDKVSGEAAKFSIANEYDKLMSFMGSQGTNAHTWVEETVYEEDIPANAVDRFLTVQAERFRNPILRIFHTELEAVYEEKNRGLDNDAWKIQEASYAAVFPSHNYGQQTTIGTIEHLKNPSLKAIREYYYKYYVPNNMAIVLSGDLNPDAVIKLIDTKFSYMKPKPVEEYKGPIEKEIQGPIVKNIYGPSAESVRLSYRIGANNTQESLMAILAASILTNGKAGLLDLNLNKQQKVQSSGASADQFKDYGIFNITGAPKQNQTLEQVKDLLLEQVEILKKGNFDETLIKAIVANYKLSELQQLEDNNTRVRNLVDGFIKHKGLEWHKDVAALDALGKITKPQIVEFANRFFLPHNYVITYKHKGEDASIVKVEKPSITPVETNAGKQSEFVKTLTANPLSNIAPVWLDYNKDFQKNKIGNANMYYVQNKSNSLFRLHYRFNMGNWNNKMLGLAMQYLQFIGTNKYSAEDISKEFYNLACSFSTNVTAEETTVTITGLQENFDKAVKLFEELINESSMDEAALQALKGRILKQRANNKLNKQAIANALRNYAFFGKNNPTTYNFTNNELNNLSAEDLIGIIRSLFTYEHSIVYYGPKSMSDITTSIQKQHSIPATFREIPKSAQFERVKQTSNKVYFVDYDMVQAEIYWARNLDPYNSNQEPVANAFNAYFGGGMGSLVFQTIRESKALAYATYAFAQTPNKKEDNFVLNAYVGTQADKLNESIVSMNELLNNLPIIESNFSNAIKILSKDIETERIEKDNIVFNYLSALKKGLTSDIRKPMYESYKKMTLKDLEKFHQDNLSNKPYTYFIVASEKRIKQEDLAVYGEVNKLSLEEVFGY